jgi:hypothetical protein
VIHHGAEISNPLLSNISRSSSPERFAAALFENGWMFRIQMTYQDGFTFVAQESNDVRSTPGTTWRCLSFVSLLSLQPIVVSQYVHELFIKNIYIICVRYSLVMYNIYMASFSPGSV